MIRLRARNVVAELAAGRAPALVWPDGAEMTDGIIALGRRCMSPRPEDRPDLKEVLEVGAWDDMRCVRPTTKYSSRMFAPCRPVTYCLPSA